MKSPPETRASFILRLQSADDSMVWDEFVTMYQPVIYRTSRNQGLGHEDAVDVTQEVMTRVTKSIDRWQHDPQRGSFRGWLYRITKNVSIDFLRKAHKRPSTGNQTTIFAVVADQAVDRESEEFDRQFERQLFRQAASRIEHQFTESTWQAFWMTAVDGKPVNEVVDALGISRGAVYIARSRVMSRLKQEVGKALRDTLGESQD